jgi:sugar phosphate isomerase/epimerase
MTREAGLDPFCYGSYYRFREIDRQSHQPGPEIEAVLDTAEALGSRRIRLWAGEQDFEDASESFCEAVAEKAREIGEQAQVRGLAIDLEFHRGTLNNSADHSLKLFGMIGHKNIHTLWQPDMSLPFKERLGGLHRLLPHVSNLHCFHWGPGGFQDRRPLAEGTSEWEAYLAELGRVDQQRWISLEFVKDDSMEALIRDSRTLSVITSKPGH